MKNSNLHFVYIEFNCSLSTHHPYHVFTAPCVQCVPLHTHTQHNIAIALVLSIFHVSLYEFQHRSDYRIRSRRRRRRGRNRTQNPHFAYIIEFMVCSWYVSWESATEKRSTTNERLYFLYFFTLTIHSLVNMYYVAKNKVFTRKKRRQYASPLCDGDSLFAVVSIFGVRCNIIFVLSTSSFFKKYTYIQEEKEEKEKKYRKSTWMHGG